MSPDRLPQDRGRVWEDHPFEIGLSLALFLFGVRGTVDAASRPGMIDVLPLALSIAYCAVSVIGGALTLIGIFTRSELWIAGSLERSGLYLSGAAWAGYAVAIAVIGGTSRSTLVVSALLALCAASVIRGRVSSKREKLKLQALQIVNRRDGVQ